jgi:hypothetical protein
MSSDKIVYGNTTYEDLLKEIHKKSKDKDKQITALINQLKPLIGDTVNSAIMVVPLISNYLNSSLKNDDNLIKLATLVQRTMAPDSSGSDDFSMSDEERELILKQVSSINNEVSKPVDKQQLPNE